MIGGELSMFDNTIRFMGMGNTMFNTNDLVDAELQILKLQNQPLEKQREAFQIEKRAWDDFKSSLNKLSDYAWDLRNHNPNEKIVSYSSQGFVSASATAVAVEGSYSMEISSVATKHQIVGDSFGVYGEPLNREDTMLINGNSFSVTVDMNLDDVAKGINGGNYGVSASIISNRLVLTADETGTNNGIVLEDGTNGFLKEIGLLDINGGIKNELTQAKDANYSINGIALTSTTNEIKDAVAGVTFNLENETTTPITVNIKNDTEKAKEMISNFVTEYNNFNKSLHKYTDKGSPLQGKTIPLNVNMSLSGILSFVSKDGLMPHNVGIEVDGTTKDGSLKIDQAKLNEALENEPENVARMFFGTEGSLGKTLYDKIQSFTSSNGSVTNTMSGLDKRIETINDTLDKRQVFFERQRESLLKKYAQFESQMAQLNSSLSYISAQMEALNTNNSNK